MSQKAIEYYMNLPYETVVRKLNEQEGGGYFVSIPLLGTACTNAWGKTIAEAFDTLQEVLHDNIANWLELGLQIPEPQNECKSYSGKFALRMPPYLHRRIAETAQSEGISLNQLICNALSEFSARQNPIHRVASPQ